MKKVDIDIQSLRIFLDVCSDFSMTTSARRLNLTQPTVSASIQKIETALQTSLFDRSTRPLRLTPAGRMLFIRARGVIDNYERMVSEVLSARHEVKPDLRVGYSDSISSIFAPYLVPQLLPYVSYFTPIMGLTPLISKLLLSEKVDIAISTDSLQRVKGVRCIPVFSEKFLVVAPLESVHDLNIATLRDLTKELPLIRFNQYCQSQIEVDRLLRELDIAYQSRVEADTNAMILKLVSTGFGWSIVPALAILHEKDYYHGVQLIPIHSALSVRQTFVVYKDVYFEALAKKIAQIIRELVTEVVLPEVGKIDKLLSSSIGVLY